MPGASQQGVAERGPANFPADLVSYIEAGNPVRNDKSDPLPGRCGAEKERKGGKTAFCGKAAGSGTKHKGVGRCNHHEGSYATGLAPWVGPIDEADWLRITGGQPSDPETGRLQRTHGSTEGLLPFEAIMARRLDPEDLAAYLAAPLEPATVIDANLRERWMAKDRIYRYLQRVRARVEASKLDVAEQLRQALIALEAMQPDGGFLGLKKTEYTQLAEHVRKLRADIRQLDHYADTVAIEVEPTLNRITAVFARLLEAKARFREIEGTQQTREALRDVIGALTDDDFNRVKNDPVALATLISSAGGIPS